MSSYARWTVIAALACSVALASCGDTSTATADQNYSQEQRVAARVALRFAGLERKRDVAGACRLAAGKVRRLMRCDGKRPRTTGELEYKANKPLTVKEILRTYHDGSTVVRIVPGNPILSITVNANNKVISIANFALQ